MRELAIFVYRQKINNGTVDDVNFAKYEAQNGTQ